MFSWFFSRSPSTHPGRDYLFPSSLPSSCSSSRDGRVPIVYRDEYNISFWGLEGLHPFDSQKYRRVHDRLLSLGHLNEGDSYSAPMATLEQLHLVHPDPYLDTLVYPSTIARMVEIAPVALLPASSVYHHVLLPMLFAVGGSIKAADLAVGSAIAAGTAGPRPTLGFGWAINLGGGYHHASSDRGEGFCIFADISMIIRHLQRNYPVIKKLLIVDLDAHQGNGFEKDKLDGVFNNAAEPNQIQVRIFDAFNFEIYPQATQLFEQIDYNHQLPKGTADHNYLQHVRQVNEAIRKYRPNFVIYNAGTDILVGDRLGALAVSAEGIIQRDEIVFRACHDNGVPLVMLLSGGYQKSNADIIADSIANLKQRLQLW